MKYLPFDIAIRLTHNVRYVKGQLIERPLCIVRYVSSQAQDILTASEKVVRSLTCDNLDLVAPDLSPSVSPVPPSLLPLSSEVPVVLAPQGDKVSPESTPKCAPWLLSRMILMGLDSYFPQLYIVSSLWAPL
ncbi:hypothetical protein DSO57_1026409 [Entomophthora muscae]|uniref:Uncharacterized protein n=1 Tax=Entomophthora muscae TaxID=34485 RepID=A0ACC2UBQ0_9FUNG|nr:hypothetical protein DSO57_1026409 [Entomophthora muscae]